MIFYHPTPRNFQYCSACVNIILKRNMNTFLVITLIDSSVKNLQPNKKVLNVHTFVYINIKSVENGLNFKLEQTQKTTSIGQKTKYQSNSTACSNPITPNK